MKVASLQDVLIDELQDLFDAEKQLVRALPKMAKAASDPELENLFREHLEVTKGQVQRLEQVFGLFDQRARSKPCLGMKGLVEEGQEILSEDRPKAMLDAAILGAARKVEHYEMAGYSSCITIAQQLGMREAVQLLNETLREETETEHRLAQAGKRLVKEVSRLGQQAEGGEQRRQTRTRSTQGTAKRAAGQSRSGRRTTARAGARTTRGSRSQAGGRQSGAGAQPLTDHDEIRRWAEERGAQPARVRGTGGQGDTGMIRLDFPGYGGEESLDHISWDDWFEKFDSNNLALMVQERTSRGQKSNFNKIVSREAAQGRGRRAPRVKRAGG